MIFNQFQFPSHINAENMIGFLQLTMFPIAGKSPPKKAPGAVKNSYIAWPKT